MDEKDEKILEALLRNSRTPLTQIAASIGVSETAVRKRIKKMEEEGIIKAYTALIDPFYLGYSGVALVGVDATSEELLNVFEYIKSLPVTRYGALTSGDHMMMFEIWCRGPKELNKLLKNIEAMKGVTRVCPAVLLKRVE